ncbi:ankyrin repeat protein [Colletotrichum kahawae]|uniref:Ankyrin repeat protein n=1 Tax=Colletotrichum kahawae TaxID=34407 RepID=A0AAD9YKX9_COLKA|nr:ankyrin repeat protein [Colletotrichum kahawae]
MQFLSLSMGWADNVLLAMGPLGIITIVVSTIRISGGRRLKSLIGR